MESIETQRSNANALRWMIVGGGLLILLAGGGAAWALTTYTRELMAARSEVETLNVGLEARVKERTADLRAPLVNVMGFTGELETSLGPLQALMADPVVNTSTAAGEVKPIVETDIPEAISFIRKSTKKMDALINAILKLSREGQRTLTPEPISLYAMFEGIAGGVQHRLGETAGSILIQTRMPTVVADRLALEQIFGNIIDNAIKYRSPERPPLIQVRHRADGGAPY
jgi:signal transduction histidine kinase